MKHTLRGSTLAETLVMMLVAGIVFLAAMEALTLVSQLVARLFSYVLTISGKFIHRLVCNGINCRKKNMPG